MLKNVLGVDEAGRGAVIGPLVMGGAFFPKGSITSTLKSIGVKDSKLLSHKKRQELYEQIKKLGVKTVALKITPAKIDRYSINDLEAIHTAKIINKLLPSLSYVDVPASGRGIKNYCDKIKSNCSKKVKIIGGNKMDLRNILVAAASIIAKENREREVKKLHKKFGDFGSGYPADPKTKKWLKSWKKQNAGTSWPKIVRVKWSTIKTI